MRSILALTLSFPFLGFSQFADPIMIIGHVQDGPRDARTADIDGDGDLDVASVAEFDGQVSWWPNEGNGDPGLHRSISNATVDPTLLGLGDLDHDGDIDAVVANSGDHTITWFANLGGGDFDPTPNLIYTASNEVTALYAVDLNGDTWPDLLGEVRNGTTDDVFWIPSTDEGAFGPVQVISTSPYPTHSLEHADIDHDTDQDIFWVINNARIIRRNNSGDFNSIDFYSGPTTPRACLGDLDGNDAKDIVAARVGDFGPELLWMQNDGFGSYSALEVIGSYTGGTIYDMTAFDVDGDDREELIISYQDGVQTMQRFTDGELSPADTIHSRLSATIISAADIDEDGRLDLLSTWVFGDRVGYFRNNGTGAFEEEPRFISNTVLGGGRVCAIDVDGDGLRDVTTTSFLTHELMWFRNDGTPNFSPQRFADVDLNEPGSTVSLDFDNDGDDDILVATDDDVIIQYENLGNGTLQEGWHMPTDMDPRNLQVADLNGDGIRDLLYSCDYQLKLWWILMPVGTGGGSSPIMGSFVSDLCAADLDGDDDMDMLRAASNFGVHIGYLENNGATEFPEFNNIPFAEVQVTKIAADDLDNNGTADIVAVLNTTPGPQIRLSLNDGSGTFPTAQTIVDTLGTINVLMLYDVDADGDQDLLIGTAATKRIVWMANDGAANFAPPQLIAQLAATPYEITMADLDNDGDEEMILASGGTDVLWLENLTSVITGMPATANPPGPVVSPNPSDGAFIIDFGKALSPNDLLELVDVSGRVVRTLRVPGGRELRVDARTLQRGLYTLRSRNDEGLTTRIIIE